MEDNPCTPYYRYELREAINGKKGSVSQAIEKLKTDGLIKQIGGAWVFVGETLTPMDARSLPK